MQFLALWTVLQFGWRIFSRSAIDFRKRDAQERMRLYLSRALFLTLEKLDIQFLVRRARGVEAALAMAFGDRGSVLAGATGAAQHEVVRPQSANGQCTNTAF